MYPSRAKSLRRWSSIIFVLTLWGCATSSFVSEPPGGPAPVPAGQISKEKPLVKADEHDSSLANEPSPQTQELLFSLPGVASKVLPSPSKPTHQETTALSIVTTPTPAPSDVFNGPMKDPTLSEGINLNTPVLILQASTEQIGVGEQVSLTIKAEQVRDLFSAPFYLRYDPQVLEFIGLTEGGFLKQDNNPTAFIYAVEPEIGQVIVGLSRLGEVTGISGSGTLALATFKAKNPGRASVTFQNVDFRDTRFEAVSVIAEMSEIQIR